LRASRATAAETRALEDWHMLAFGEPRNDGAFRPLPGTKKELDDLVTLSKGRFPLTVRRAADASKESFLELAPLATHIHIATHATADFQSEQPYIVFSGSGEQQYLRTAELSSMKLRAELVFLSACSTSVGKRSTGEGVMSLGRAFLWSGCRCVVASLWPMPDDSTPLVVESFYSELITGISPAQAAQRAREKYRRNGGSTRIWAGFQVLGDGDTHAERYRLKYLEKGPR